MSRLIDADKLIEELYLNAYACTNDEVNKILHKQLESNIEVINNQPTAYDVDKVIKELDKDIQWYQFLKDNLKCNGTVITSDRDMYILNQRVLRMAKDRVKAGGIDDN